MNLSDFKVIRSLQRFHRNGAKVCFQNQNTLLIPKEIMFTKLFPKGFYTNWKTCCHHRS